MNPQPPNQTQRPPEQKPPEPSPPPRGPSLASLAKAALKLFPKAGQTAKAGAAEIFTKLGLKALAGVVSGTASGGITLAVTALTTVAGFVWNNFLKPLFVKLKKEPEKIAPYLIGTGIGALVLFPGSIIGIATAGSLITLGGIGLLNWGTASGGFALGSVAGKAVALFTALLTLPFAAPIGLFVVGTLGVLAALTLFIVMVASGAFILPAPEKGGLPAGQITHAFGQPTEAQNLPRGAYPNDRAYLAEKIIYLLTEECRINKVNRENWDQVEACLKAAGPPPGSGIFNLGQMTAIIDEFRYSVFQVKGDELECVGFFRAIVKASAGRPMGDEEIPRSDAKGYYATPPLGWQNNVQLGEPVRNIQPGDTAIFFGGEYGDPTFGHIAFVVRVREDEAGNRYAILAHAYGEDGTITMEAEVALYKIDGFIRPI